MISAQLKFPLGCLPKPTKMLVGTRRSSCVQLLGQTKFNTRKPGTSSATVLRKQKPLCCCCCVRSPAEEELAVEPPPLGPGRESALPRHVAMILDGNSRWARARGLTTSEGHLAGFKNVMEIAKLSRRWGIRALTVYAFSTENWRRPKAEVDCLMMLFENIFRENQSMFLRESIRVCIIGDSSDLPESLQKCIKEVEKTTRNNSRLKLNVAINYSGRSDIVQACRKIAQRVEHGLLESTNITESSFAEELGTKCSTEFPYPDLVIRTSGEMRLSNFLLWELAYSELYFTKINWPDFGEVDYTEALLSFQTRERRFGLRTTA